MKGSSHRRRLKSPQALGLLLREVHRAHSTEGLDDVRRRKVQCETRPRRQKREDSVVGGVVGQRKAVPRVHSEIHHFLDQAHVIRPHHPVAEGGEHDLLTRVLVDVQHHALVGLFIVGPAVPLFRGKQLGYESI